LLHPVIPFVTEELWTVLTGAETVVRAAWPVAQPALVDDAAEEELGALQRVVTEVRRFRSDQGLRPGQRVSAALTGLGNVGIDRHEQLIRSLARLEAPAEGFSTTSTSRPSAPGSRKTGRRPRRKPPSAGRSSTTTRSWARRPRRWWRRSRTGSRRPKPTWRELRRR